MNTYKRKWLLESLIDRAPKYTWLFIKAHSPNTLSITFTNKVTYNTVGNIFMIVLMDQLGKDKLNGTVRYKETSRVYLKNTDQLGCDYRGSLLVLDYLLNFALVNIFIELDETKI